MGLALSRATGQSITIGDDIRVTVIRVQGKAVKLLVEAPAEMRVGRDDNNPPPPQEETCQPPAA